MAFLKRGLTPTQLSGVISELQPQPKVLAESSIKGQRIHLFIFADMSTQSVPQKVMLFLPCADRTAEKGRYEPTLADVLKAYKDRGQDTGIQKAMFVIAQQNHILGLIPRRHYTLLVIDETNSDVPKIDFYDPKAYLFYSTSPMREMLRQQGFLTRASQRGKSDNPTDAKLCRYQEHYIGTQALTNDADCGLFCADFAQKISKGKVIEPVRSRFRQLLEKIWVILTLGVGLLASFMRKEGSIEPEIKEAVTKVHPKLVTSMVVETKSVTKIMSAFHNAASSKRSKGELTAEDFEQVEGQSSSQIPGYDALSQISQDDNSSRMPADDDFSQTSEDDDSASFVSASSGEGNAPVSAVSLFPKEPGTTSFFIVEIPPSEKEVEKLERIHLENFKPSNPKNG